MGDEAESGEGQEPTPTPSNSGFSQEDLTRIATREKQQGVRAGQREVLEALGFESLDQAKEFAKSIKDAEQAKLTEADRAKAEADRIKAEAAREKAEAAQERFSARIERELLRAGVDLDRVGKVSRLVEADVDSSPEDIATAVADLKNDMPELFGKTSEEENGEPGTQQSGTPQPPPSDPGKAPGTKSTATPSERAKQRLMARHGDRLSKS